MPLSRVIARLKPMILDTLLSSKALSRGLFDQNELHRILTAHFDGRLKLHNEIWALLWLELWFGMWIDTKPNRSF